jgi:hypothetical protein
MTEPAGSQPLDGGWWPQSRDLTVELADLVDNFPAASGRVVRATFSPPDWDDSPRRVPTARGYVPAGFSRHDGANVMMLKTSERNELCLLVIPPEMSPAQGEEALRAAVTPRYAPSPGLVLQRVREHVAHDRVHHVPDDVTPLG